MSFPIQKNKNIIIIGDVMLDQFYYGNLEDTSKEDPLAKILKVKSQSDNLGGAGNVAMNIKTMASNPHLISVVGDDLAGKRIRTLCQENGINDNGILVDDQRPTTIKTRLYDKDQIIRFDQESYEQVVIDIEDKLLAYFEKLISENNIDGVILQDYNKGVLNQSSIKRILSITKKNNLPVFVDPKKDNFFAYKQVTVFKPNLREINWAMPGTSYQDVAVSLLEKLDCEIAAITLSEDGIFLSKKTRSNLYPSMANEIVDVCGAGDTVISIITLTYLSKCNMSGIGVLANLAAANVCLSKGVNPINYKKLSDLYLSHRQDKDKNDIK